MAGHGFEERGNLGKLNWSFEVFIFFGGDLGEENGSKEFSD